MIVISKPEQTESKDTESANAKESTKGDVQEKEVDKEKAADNGDLTLANGYRTESGRPLSEADSNEFIVKSDGNADLGHINERIAKATNNILQIAPIRLQVGNDGFGYIHLLKKHADQISTKGYGVMDYIHHILENFNQIYSQQTKDKPNRFILYCKDDSKGFMPIDLEFAQTGDYYTIVSVLPHKAKIKGTLLFNGSASPSTATTNGTLLKETSNNGGAGTSSNTHGKNNVPSTSSIAEEDSKANTESSNQTSL